MPYIVFFPFLPFLFFSPFYSSIYLIRIYTLIYTYNSIVYVVRSDLPLFSFSTSTYHEAYC